MYVAPMYEAPLRTRFCSEKNAPRGRPTNDETQLHERRFTGYSVAYVSNTDELTSYEHPTDWTENLGYESPRVMADEERTRPNTVGTRGVRDIFKGIEKRRRNRWSACVWFALIFSCVALLLSGISLHQAFMIRKRVLTGKFLINVSWIICKLNCDIVNTTIIPQIITVPY